VRRSFGLFTTVTVLVPRPSHRRAKVIQDDAEQAVVTPPFSTQGGFFVGALGTWWAWNDRLADGMTMRIEKSADGEDQTDDEAKGASGQLPVHDLSFFFGFFGLPLTHGTRLPLPHSQETIHLSIQKTNTVVVTITTTVVVLEVLPLPLSRPYDAACSLISVALACLRETSFARDRVARLPARGGCHPIPTLCLQMAPMMAILVRVLMKIDPL
jgi:hypothetical protein